MNVYLYIAENNPDGAYEICKKYGYFNVQSIEELAENLQAIVAGNGQESLQEILEIHPEKDVILELFDKKKVEEKPDLELLVKTIVQQDRDMERETKELFFCVNRTRDKYPDCIPYSTTCVVVEENNTKFL
jgi:hypothetical protein